MSTSALTAPGVQALSCRGTSRSSIQYSRSRAPLRIQPRAFILRRSLALLFPSLGAVFSSSASDDGMGHPISKQPIAGMMVSGTEEIMKKKSHGTCANPVQEKLRWGCDRDIATRICCHNRHYAEFAGYAMSQTTWLNDIKKRGGETTYYDPTTGKPLFIAPKGRSVDEFIAESKSHGWPSFRDEEVVWENVRILPDGETVSVDGAHLGHNLPDRKGNRYCINLVSCAGYPADGGL
mmetsp:Transcript_10807/g.39638  ORF Transcript_10807/g.39638 Transcript_10807/m.39638 type:complete len:236 (-) Transcript_10807:248-955(-)